MALTGEQQEIVDKSVELYFSNEEESYIQVDAIAGSGKSHTLVEIINSIYNHKLTNKNLFKSRYFAYSKKLATESEEKFNKNITECSTIHSMAWRNTVRQLSLKVIQGTMYGSMLEMPTLEEKKHFKFISRAGLSHQGKEKVIYHLDQFYLSRFNSITDYITNLDFEIRDTETEELMQFYFSKMASGNHSCTHSFYQKLFHILLHKNLLKNIETFDVLLYDEVGDANEVSLEIFKLLKSKLKVMVGDNLQNIFGFNNTVNGFETMKEYGNLYSLSKSFRVSSRIAKPIESFGKKYASLDMVFKGIDYDKKSDKSMAFLSRTNSALVGKMIELDSKNIPYNLTKTADEMFKIPIGLLSIKEGKEISTPELKHIQKTVNEYYDSLFIQREFKSLFGYILSQHDDDISIKTACTIISIHKPQKIWDTYLNAKKHAVGKKDHYITLATSHASKGLEWDVVNIMDDLNEKLEKILIEAEELVELTNSLAKTKEEMVDLIDVMTSNQRQEVLLYYVAISRSKHKLINAKHLKAGYIIE